MYRITIAKEEDLPHTGPGPLEALHTPIYQQRFDELDVPDIIRRINQQPRTRGPRKKKGEK